MGDSRQEIGRIVQEARGGSRERSFTLLAGEL
jgi:hypothetical protein